MSSPGRRAVDPTVDHRTLDDPALDDLVRQVVDARTARRRTLTIGRRRIRLDLGLAVLPLILSLVLSGLALQHLSGGGTGPAPQDDAASSQDVIDGDVLLAAAKTPAGGFATKLIAVNSGLCWTASPPKGAVSQQRCVRTSRQTVAFVPSGGHYQIRTPSGCLAATTPVTANGGLLQAGACPGVLVDLQPVTGVAQGFRLLPAAGHCIDVLGGQSAEGTPIGVWDCGNPSTSGHQIFRFTAVPAGLRTLPAVVAVSAAPGSTSAAPSSPAGPAPSLPVPPVATAPAPQPSDTTPTPALGDYSPDAVIRAGLAGTAPQWGKALPPAGAVFSRAYKLASSNVVKGYQPQAGECSVDVHARYWMWGPDGKVYPTWHPAKDPSGCTFGHEHGADPRTSNLFGSVGWIPFGYTNEMLAPSNPDSQRTEDHVGHKIEILNQVAAHPGNNVNLPASQVCDSYLLVHQGTHSPDALASNLHQLSYNVRCRHTDDNSITEGHVSVLLPIGVPGGFNTNDSCDGSGTTFHANVATPAPADSVAGGGHRKIPDSDCAAKVRTGQFDVSRMNELWTLELHAGGQGPLVRIDADPYAHVSNPARYYDPSSPNKIGYTVDLCYEGAKGADCDTVRAITARTGKRVAFNDPDSPFNGSRRRVNPNYFVIVNTGPSTLYSDVFGNKWSTTPFPGSIKQFVSGTHNDPSGGQGDIFVGGDVGPHEDNYGADASLRLHAPN